MLCVPSFAIARLSVLARQNPDMSRSRARGRPGMTHDCRLRIKIVKFPGVIANLSVPDSSYSPYTQLAIPACTTTSQHAFSHVAEPEQGTLRPSKRRRRREARPPNLVSAMRAFAYESATTKASQGMSGARIRKRPFYLSSSATPTSSAVIRQTSK